MVRQPPFLQILLTGILLSLLGWGGLVVLIFSAPPDLGPRWLFFFLLTTALSGTVLPVVSFLHYRFPTQPLVDGGVIVRESIWFGIYGSLLAWLQQGHVLDANRALFLGIGFILLEVLLRMLERSRWKPE
jgi:hypothetical protein